MEGIPTSKNALTEALALSGELLRNIELNEIPLVNIALKASRLARLLNEFDYQKIFAYETSGYPSNPDGVPPDIFNLAVLAGRDFFEKDVKTSKEKKYIFTSSLEDLELQTRIAPTALDAARDPSVSLSSANPNQYLYGPQGNSLERQRIITSTATANNRLSSRRAFIYQYVLRKHYELKYSSVSDDIFSRIRHSVDDRIGSILPDSIQKFTSVYENLQSDNPEDWSNAVHSCRRLLQDLADIVCPARDDVVQSVKGKNTTRKLGKENYINRIVFFIESKSDSDRFKDIVGSNLQFIGDRLDGVFKATQKGSHDTITSRTEADRYVAYTYLLIGDIISLVPHT